jgi:hypothetical protein
MPIFGLVLPLGWETKPKLPPCGLVEEQVKRDANEFGLVDARLNSQPVQPALLFV